MGNMNASSTHHNANFINGRLRWRTDVRAQKAYGRTLGHLLLLPGVLLRCRILSIFTARSSVFRQRTASASGAPCSAAADGNVEGGNTVASAGQVRSRRQRNTLYGTVICVVKHAATRMMLVSWSSTDVVTQAG